MLHCALYAIKWNTFPCSFINRLQEFFEDLDRISLRQFTTPQKLLHSLGLFGGGNFLLASILVFNRSNSHFSVFHVKKHFADILNWF